MKVVMLVDEKLIATKLQPVGTITEDIDTRTG